MLRNLMDPLEKAAPGLAHVCLLQGTKAYGVHVRPMRFPARERRSEMREQSLPVPSRRHVVLLDDQAHAGWLSRGDGHGGHVCEMAARLSGKAASATALIKAA
jgi:hypothetical protein